MFRLADVAADGEHVLVTSDARNGWRNVAVINVRTRAITWVTDERANHVGGGFSEDARFLVYNRDGDLDCHIFAYDLQTKRTRQLTQGRSSYEMQRMDSNLGEPNPSTVKANRVLALRHSGTAPAQIVSVGLDGEEQTVVANPLPPTLSNAVVNPVGITYRSTDGQFSVPALVWLPRNLKRDGSHPAVIEIHGGPMPQTRPHLLTYIQVLVAQGYVVVSPNYRGSMGTTAVTSSPTAWIREVAISRMSWLLEIFS